MAVNFEPMQQACVEQFGTTITYTPEAGVAYQLSVVLESGEEVEQRYEGAHFTAWAEAESFAAEPVKGDTATIGAQSFRVVDVIRSGPQAAPGRLLLLKYIRP